MFRPLLIRFLWVLVLIGCVEAALRFGLWNRFALPNSHAGTTVRALNAWSVGGDAPVDTVTLGSSRPEHGFDNVALAALAQKHGQRHLSFAMPSSHMLTIDTVSSWLKQHRPEVKNRVIALSILDFTWASNGDYELGNIAPLDETVDWARLRQRQPLKTDSGSWGSVSAIWRYRRDLRDAVFSPKQRLNALKNPSVFNRAHNTQVSQNLCQMDTASLASCAQAPATGIILSHGAEAARQLCVGWNAQFGKTPGGDVSVQPYSPEILLAQRLIRSSLSRETWPGKTVVVLMPTHHLWTLPPMATGHHALALAVLQPLADSGDITLIDATTVLDVPNPAFETTNARLQTDCTTFGDLFHQNDVGREKLTLWLMPQLERALYP